MSDEEQNASNIEQEAYLEGWRPLEEFKGNPEKWVSAEEYLRRGEVILPLLRKNYKDLKKELTDRDRKHEAEITELKSTLTEVREFYSKAEQRAYEKAVKDVRAEMKRAVSEGDTDAYNAAEAQLDELTTKIETPQKSAGPKPAPGWENPAETLAEWRKDNEWYWTDPHLGMEAQQVSVYLGQTKPGQTMMEQLQEVTRLMKEKYPEKFGLRRKGADDVDGRGERGATKRKGKHTYADLPEEDKKLFKRFERDIPNYTWEEFESTYEWEK